tara:strand:+ start:98 stop:349 length:252 start_codon:yes stop_codon:yes gene_type:complete
MSENTKLKLVNNKIDTELINNIIFLAWSDKISFEEILLKTSLTEDKVVKIMRQKLKHKSFVNWRKRVRGRKSKHRKLNEIRYD